MKTFFHEVEHEGWEHYPNPNITGRATRRVVAQDKPQPRGSEAIHAADAVGAAKEQDPVYQLGHKVVSGIMASSAPGEAEERWSIFRHEVKERVRNGDDVPEELMIVAGVNPNGTTQVPIPQMATYYSG